jgi:hypothetical protein
MPSFGSIANDFFNLAMHANGLSDMLGRLIAAGNYLKVGRMPRPGIVAYVVSRILNQAPSMQCHSSLILLRKN